MTKGDYFFYLKRTYQQNKLIGELENLTIGLERESEKVNRLSKNYLRLGEMYIRDEE